MLVWRSFWTLSRGLVPQWCIRESVDDNHSRSIGSNTHQLKLGSQAGGRAIRRGEGGGCGVGWALMVARRWGWDPVPPSWEPGEQDAGDLKGPPHIHLTALAPTGVWVGA